MHIAKSKKPIGKDYIMYCYKLYNILERKETSETLKKISGGQWKYSAQNYNDGFKSLHIYPKPQNV